MSTRTSVAHSAETPLLADLPTARFLTQCRICKSDRLVEFLALGEQPHCNAFLRPEQLTQPEPRWPLTLLYCEDCHLVQLSCAVDPAFMFAHYPYISGTTRTLRQHFAKTATDLVAEFRPKTGDLVVDIGSNDGTLLSSFKAFGLRTVGVDPATNIAELASKNGITTINEFFGERVANEIRERHRTANLMTAAGVFFHIDDMDDVCRGVSTLLARRGVFQIQAIYLGAMLERTSFDNVYHEHVSYYTLAPLVRLLERFDLSVFHIVLSPIHGGSLLVYVCKPGAYAVRDSVRRQLAYENAKGWDTLSPYREFARRVEKVRADLLAILCDLRACGKRIAAYGAPAKGTTLLNYCGIGTGLLEYAAEKSSLKIGLYTPGMHVPVVAEEQAMKTPPDYFLLLPWNFSDELLQKNAEYRRRGGRFIIPIPTPKIV